MAALALARSADLGAQLGEVALGFIERVLALEFGAKRDLQQLGCGKAALLQIALRAELERQDALDETERYLAELSDEVGEPTQRQRSHADVIARRIRDRSLDRVS